MKGLLCSLLKFLLVYFTINNALGGCYPTRPALSNAQHIIPNHYWCMSVILFNVSASLFSFFFVPGNRDIVLELLSTMTKARDIAFVDKVGDYQS